MECLDCDGGLRGRTGGILIMLHELGFSIIVPTYGSPTWVNRALVALTVARLQYAGPAEIIVSDGSDDDASAAIRKHAEDLGAVYVHGERGASRQRNRGAREANFPILLFVDSDCEAEPGLLSPIAAAFSDSSVAAVAGRVRFTGPRSLVFRAMSTTGVLDAFEGFSGKNGPVPWGVTANFAVRRESFERIGGFDETFPRDAGGEDVDLGLRLSSVSPTIVYSAQAIVRHPTEPWNTVMHMIPRLLSYGRADVYLLLRHPYLAVIDGPNLFLGFWLFAIASFWLAFSRQTAWWLLMPLVWSSLTLILFAMFTPGGIMERLERTVGLLFLQFLDAGRILEALRRFRWHFLWTRVHLDDAQTARDWAGIHRTWIAGTFAALICNLLVWLLHD